MATKTKNPNAGKYGVWVNGKLEFANIDYDIAESFAQYQLRKIGFTANVWLAKVGSFVSV